MNWLLELPDDELNYLLSWMAASGTTATLKMLDALHVTSKLFRVRVGETIDATVNEQQRQAVLASSARYTNQLHRLLTCHRVFSRPLTMPAWIDLNDIEDEAFDSAMSSNEQTTCEAADTLRGLLEHGQAPQAVERAALCAATSNTTSDDGDQAYILLGSYFGSVLIEEGPRSLERKDAARLGAVLGSPGLSWRLPHTLCKLCELQQDLERDARGNVRQLARMPHLTAEQLGPVAVRESVPLAVLRGWWRRARQQFMPRRVRGEDGPPDVALFPSAQPQTLQVASLLRGVREAVDMSLALPPFDGNEDDEDEHEYAPPARGTLSEYKAVGELCDRVYKMVSAAMHDGVEFLQGLPLEHVREMQEAVLQIGHLTNVIRDHLDTVPQ